MIAQIEWGNRKSRGKPGAALTDKQRAILDFIRRHYRETGLPSTLREIMRFTGLTSTNSVMVHFRPLIRKGYLRQAGTHVSRSYLPATDPGCCPCCGRSLPSEADPS